MSGTFQQGTSTVEGSQPTPRAASGPPSDVAGRFKGKERAFECPILALMDGLHVGQYVQAFEAALKDPQAWFCAPT